VTDSPRQADDVDRRLMAGAIALAWRGVGRTAPNPAVGAVVYQPWSGEIVGRGWTQRGGRPHAEPVALAAAGEAARGATLYVTLEPCAHHGRTPPCTDAVIAAGIARVVHGVTDPDPRVAGRGLRLLAEAGIETGTSVLREAAREVTIGHILRVSERRPFITLKIAVDARGCVAEGRDGKPTWVTGPAARARGHLMRAESDAILIGRGTAEADNPGLDCRLPGVADQSPLPVILSTSANLPPDLALFSPDRKASRPLVFVGPGAVPAARAALGAGGIEWAEVGEVGGRLWIPAVLEALVERGMTRLLVEGGPAIWHAFDRAGMIDEVALFRGGQGAAQAFDSVEACHMLSRYVSLTPLEIKQRLRLGDDDLVRYVRA
jgi:diaminohydroxyphosphoribosylaminopyrimidine deaminase/5-amino-6-(5-phosphoribosylamino)uracil reductase